MKIDRTGKTILLIVIIISLICCCIPAGILAFVLQVEKKLDTTEQIAIEETVETDEIPVQTEKIETEIKEVLNDTGIGIENELGSSSSTLVQNM
jgi:Na+-transporting NADH:ubiquinone oxidoreductase subunit NqrC